MYYGQSYSPSFTFDFLEEYLHNDIPPPADGF